MTENQPIETNPYIAPPAEGYSPTLTKAERVLLTEFLEMPGPNAGQGALSRSMTRSLLCSPIAILFAWSFAAVTYLVFELSPVIVVAAAAFAFLAVMAGFFLRDLGEDTNTRALREILCSITDFAEAERLLYGRPKANEDHAIEDEPLAAIPVEMPTDEGR